MSPEDTRRRLIAGGYVPTPCAGKSPVLKGWQTIVEPTLAEVEFWTRTAPAATNTGVLTRLTPTLDIDVSDPEAAAAVEALARERFEERGYVLVRFGRAPKRAIPFQTDTPFGKITVNLVAPDGALGQKLELLADGQQFVAHGTHPDTGKAYSWHGGEPGEIKHEDLPYIHAEEARALVDDAAELLVEKFGYRLKTAKPRVGNGADDEPPSDWSFTPDDLTDHDRLAAFAMRLIKSGMGAGAAVNFLRSAVAGLANVDEERRQRRLKEIPGMVSSAEAKLEQERRPPESAPGKGRTPPAGGPHLAPAFSDEALALCFAERHAGDLRFVAKWSRWLSWSGTYWRADDTLRAFDRAREIIREAAKTCKAKKIATAIASARTVAATERLARSDRRHAATIEQWDDRPNIFNARIREDAP